MPFQNAVKRWNGGDLIRWIRIEQQLMELARAPAPGFPQLENLVDQGGIGRMRTGLGPMRPLEEAIEAGGGIAGEPLIAGLATDPVAPTEFGKGTGGVLGVEHKALTFVHR